MAHMIEVKASHLSLISQRDIIAKLILEAAGQGWAVGPSGTCEFVDRMGART